EIKAWIDQCRDTHQVCSTSANEGTSRPKRLLRLDKDICLASPTEPVRFAALSYCWGTNKQPITTNANLTTRYGYLEFSNLPKTLKDAIFVCRGLGLSYIWIDSLCIVQDDGEEWATEAAKMADIYSSAHVVLAASLAADATQGFLHPRHRPFEIVRRAHTVRANLDHLPLSRRGWAMQEGVLATRIVHFCPDEVLFQCKTGSRCECQGEEPNHIIRPAYNLATWPPTDPQTLRALSLDDGAGYQFFVEWTRVAREFSSRSLSYASDALPALSGIARRTQSLHPGQYIAGMWEKGFCFQLGWYLNSRTESAKIVLTRPTFSWITAPRSITYALAYQPVPVCALLHAQSTPATMDPFGRIISASVTLRG
ncbi:HET-domain-containing protein, partial [Macroventuria anomochaeta]